MDRFTIGHASDSGTIEFFDRCPDDPSLPIEECWVKVAVPGLTATRQISIAMCISPMSLFNDMARRWKGWEGELAWDSWENDLELRCSQSNRGHVAIEIEMRTGYHPEAWSIRAVIGTTAGQLDSIKGHSAAFFGSCWNDET